MTVRSWLSMESAQLMSCSERVSVRSMEGRLATHCLGYSYSSTSVTLILLSDFMEVKKYVKTRAGPEYLIIRNIRSVGWHSIFSYEIRISFSFFSSNTWHPPRNSSQLVRLAEHLHQQQTVRQWKTFVLTYSMHIFHEKCIYIWNNKLKHAKDTTCEQNFYHKTECDACVFFRSTVLRCERIWYFVWIYLLI